MPVAMVKEWDEECGSRAYWTEDGTMGLRSSADLPARARKAVGGSVWCQTQCRAPTHSRRTGVARGRLMLVTRAPMTKRALHTARVTSCKIPAGHGAVGLQLGFAAQAGGVPGNRHDATCE